MKLTIYLLLSMCMISSCTKYSRNNPYDINGNNYVFPFIIPSAGVITGQSSISIGTSALLSENVSNGIWSSSNRNIATISNIGLVYGINIGSCIISYAVSDTTGGISYATFNMTITNNNLPNSGIISGVNHLLINDTATLNETTNGGTWSSSNINIATINNNGTVRGIDTGNTIISYTVSNKYGSSVSTFLININNKNTITNFLKNGLICWLNFTGNTIDSSIDGINATNHGASLCADRYGNTNSAYIFNGINNYMTLNNSQFNFTTAFTISLWVKLTDNINSINYIINKGNYDIDLSYRIYCENPTSNSYQLVEDIFTTDRTYILSNINTDIWINIIEEYDGTNIYNYINGNLLSKKIANGLIHMNNDSIIIGARINNGVMNGYFKGNIDDIGFWNRALTINEIQLLQQ